VRADFHASGLQLDERGCPGFMLRSPAGSVAVQLNLLGTHNVSNALAAAAAAHALGVTLDGIGAGLAAVLPVKGRAVAQLGNHGVRVIDDTYNANPTSVCAAIDILAGFGGRTVLVLGDIGELGEWAEQGHRDVGEYAIGKVSALYAVGPLMTHAVQAFGSRARHFITQAELIEALGAEQQPTTTILIKGSRSAAMEHVVAALCAPGGETQ
jgi:UDP-N-acetylmuramoyl-tripeptide--D-alanyl-D-alanine ligase